MFVHRLPCGSQIGIQPLRNVRISLSRKASTRWKKKAENVFNGADLKSPEVLWSFQYSQNLGGGGSGTPVAGHRVSIQTTTRINKISGCINTADQGGYGWGRIYPNTYLLSLYDQAKRYAI